MLFEDLINEAIDRLAKDRNDANVRNRVKSILNDQYQFVANAHPWRVLQKSQEITIVPIIDTGTATITKDSRTVPISGFTLTASLQGRLFKHKNGTRWYKINFVNVADNQLILESPIAEKDASGLTYEIWKRTYTLYSNVRMVWGLDNLGDSFNKNYVQDSLARVGSFSPFQKYPFTEAGTDQFTVSYTTGTVTLSKNSNVLTAIGSSFLGNATPGAKVRVTAKTLRVKRVETNTRMILLNYAEADETTADFSVDEDNPRQIDVFVRVPSNGDAIIIPIDTISFVYPMINETKDETELTHHFRETILAFTEARYLADKTDARANNNSLLIRAQAFLEGLKANKDLVAVPYSQFHPTIPSGFGRG